MKYIFLSFLLVSLASCSPSNPLGGDSKGSRVPELNMGGVQISNSGVSVGSESGNVSVDADGKVFMNNGSGSISVGNSGVNIISGSNTTSVGKEGVSVGTGIRIPTNGTGGGEKDPEVESITKDIDTIFSDIEKGGK